MAKKIGITECLKRKYKTLKICVHITGHVSETEGDVEAESDTGSLPDQLINPERYEPMLPTAAEPTENKKPVIEDPRRLIPVYTYGFII